VTAPGASRVAAYVPDLMDRSKVAAAAPDTAFVSTPRALADVDADVYVVDLNRPGTVDAVTALAARPGRRVLGFASHVDRDTLAAARQAGCDAMKRSEFFSRLGDLLA
jgi:DNA-binding NarL/FixJ family response regulator